MSYFVDRSIDDFYFRDTPTWQQAKLQPTSTTATTTTTTTTPPNENQELIKYNIGGLQLTTDSHSTDSYN
ncbi:hypothetical protein PGT21_014364 [Puccinia graminis f. sp. tritici]|uniref:Uncharacterized protein n=1 Tax=Puccinia graminis f. sp. tritici TaxID=56615 RepID=A0A5B0PFM3_PUCGR|nr:hypothetical protein PGT21_014364 [Puccinia graminis f. sp. tritici]